MEFGDKNLSGIVKTLAENNVVVWWNTFRKKNGRIMLKVEFEEYSESDKDLNSDFNPQNVSYKKLSENQSKRNYHRAKRFREEKDNSIEHPRNFEIRHSTPVRDILDPSDCINDSPAHCFDEKSVSREHPIAYTPEPLSRDKVQSCGDNVISQDSHVLHDTVADQSVDKEIINKPSSQARLDDQSEELNICQMQKKVRHIKECGSNRFHCMLARRDFELKTYETTANSHRQKCSRLGYDLDSIIQQKRTEIYQIFKLENCIDVPPDFNA